MSSKSGICNNNFNETDASVQENDSVKENAIQEVSFDEQDSILKSASHSPEPLSEKNWKTKLNSIPEKIISNKLLLFLLSFCLPSGCGHYQPCSSQKNEPLMICLPSKPNYIKPKKKEEERKPVGMVTRNKDMELCNGKIIFGCACGKRDGLSGGANCPRSCCMNNPGCYMTPPQCWPQFKETPPPPPIPERKMICVPIELVYYDPPQKC